MSSASTLTDLSLVEDNLDLVKLVLSQTRSSWHSVLTREGARSAAFEGIADAAAHYDPQIGTRFRAYAWKRIKDAIIDEVRKELRARKIPTEPLDRIILANRLGNPGGYDTALEEPPVKPRFAIVPHGAAIPLNKPCTYCQHEYRHHHAQFGCMDWRLDRQRSGWCGCDGFRLFKR